MYTKESAMPKRPIFYERIVFLGMLMVYSPSSRVSQLYLAFGGDLLADGEANFIHPHSVTVLEHC